LAERIATARRVNFASMLEKDLVGEKVNLVLRCFVLVFELDG
jgi:hypothetical protein